MPSIATLLAERPIVPFIREADFAVREPWSIAERRLFDYLLVYIQEGDCLFHVSGRDYRPASGDFCLIQPNEYHLLHGLSNTITPYMHFDIFYNAERESSFLPSPGLVDLSPYPQFMQPRLNDCDSLFIPVVFRPAEPVPFREALLKIIGLWQDNQLLARLEAQHLAEELVLRLLKEFSPLREAGANAPDSLNWMTSYLSFRLSEKITIEEMAARAKLSIPRFAALFRERYGMPPHQYLTHMRIQHAQTLLVNRELPMAEIADYCGFANVHHFSRVFRKTTGTTPGRYRSSRKAGQQPPAGTVED